MAIESRDTVFLQITPECCLQINGTQNPATNKSHVQIIFAGSKYDALHMIREIFRFYRSEEVRLLPRLRASVDLNTGRTWPEGRTLDMPGTDTPLSLLRHHGAINSLIRPLYAHMIGQSWSNLRVIRTSSLDCGQTASRCKAAKCIRIHQERGKNLVRTTPHHTAAQGTVRTTPHHTAAQGTVRTTPHHRAPCALSVTDIFAL
ncbi:hypothetical protein RRG08_011812 [Elysia crispata]|uniref:Uncharacterized protein n=1 Tax=Elysia crispata TaxID=231223 RepID=A0AAE1CZY2_9GAST|nr:hypothetical protein RRG08_011812 [Elysia crispata]